MKNKSDMDDQHSLAEIWNSLGSIHKRIISIGGSLTAVCGAILSCWALIDKVIENRSVFSFMFHSVLPFIFCFGGIIFLVLAGPRHEPKVNQLGFLYGFCFLFGIVVTPYIYAIQRDHFILQYALHIGDVHNLSIAMNENEEEENRKSIEVLKTRNRELEAKAQEFKIFDWENFSYIILFGIGRTTASFKLRRFTNQRLLALETRISDQSAYCTSARDHLEESSA